MLITIGCSVVTLVDNGSQAAGPNMNTRVAGHLGSRGADFGTTPGGTVPPIDVIHSVTVPDVFAAVAWYRDVFGLELAVEPRTLCSDPVERPPGLDSRFREGRISCLLSGNGVSLELFQFVDTPTGPEPPEDRPVAYDRRGPWHLCFTCPDVAALTAAAVEHGGRLLTPPKRLFSDRPHVLSYVADPWGTMIELMSHAPADVFARWPSDGAFPLAPRPAAVRTAPPQSE